MPETGRDRYHREDALVALSLADTTAKRVSPEPPNHEAANDPGTHTYGLPTGDRQRALGAVYTPPEYAALLVDAAVRTPEDLVLDIGVGGGIFTFEAHRRLVEHGAPEVQAERQLYGTEIDGHSYHSFKHTAERRGRHFPNIHHQDFFRAEFPAFDAVVGNPPYVRRTYLNDVERIRQTVTQDLGLLDERTLRRTTDLSVYFLLRAATLLKPGGRLSIITADSWLTVNYGEFLRRYLLEHFDLRTLISFDRRVFHDAEVKPVLLIAEKRNRRRDRQEPVFVRVRNGLPVADLQRRLGTEGFEHPDLSVIRVDQQTLTSTVTWAVHFKASDAYRRLADHHRTVPLREVASTSIGVQTLAKPFFVLTQEQAAKHRIEARFLRPLAHSNRTYGSPLISKGQHPDRFLFYCDEDKTQLKGTQALRYIKAGERAVVPVRGKSVVVKGYHNKERIQQAGRRNWYDVKTLIEKRGPAEILLPRLVYSTYRVVWNQAGFVAGELFIEVRPKSQDAETEVYLAILNSAATEIVMRVHAQVYGGGTFNINPGTVRSVPVLNPRELTLDERRLLKEAYIRFISNPVDGTGDIDALVLTALGMDDGEQQRFLAVLHDLRHIGPSAKKLQQTTEDDEDAKP